MIRGRQQTVLLVAFAVVAVLLTGILLWLVFSPSESAVAPTEDVNPTGRNPDTRVAATNTAVVPPAPRATATPLPAPPRGTLVYERGGTIYLAVLGGQERTLVPSGQYPRLSPDGVQVAYVGQVGNTPPQLLSIGTRTRQITAITDKARNPALPVWSPDGRSVIFRAEVGETTELFVVEANGDNLRQITRAPTVTDGATQPAWSADGKSLLYKNVGDGTFYRVPLAGGAPERVRASMGQQYDLTPSPDGTFLAFTARAEVEREFALYVMDASGRNERKVANLLAVTASEQLGSLAWSPDGRAILVASGGSFAQEIYDLRTGKPTATVAYGAWPSWVAAEIT